MSDVVMRPRYVAHHTRLANLLTEANAWSRVLRGAIENPIVRVQACDRPRSSGVMPLFRHRVGVYVMCALGDRVLSCYLPIWHGDLMHGPGDLEGEDKARWEGYMADARQLAHRIRVYVDTTWAWLEPGDGMIELGVDLDRCPVAQWDEDPERTQVSAVEAEEERQRG